MTKRAPLLLLVLASACTGHGPRDVGNQNKRSEFTGAGIGSSNADGGSDGGRVVAAPNAAGKKPRVLAHASARAITTNPTHVFFGDAEDDTLYTLVKKGGAPERLTRRAPVRGALSVDGSTLAWI